MKIFPGKLRSRLALIYAFAAFVIFAASFLIGYHKQKESFQETIVQKDRDLGGKAVNSLQLIYNNSPNRYDDMRRFLAAFHIRRLISIKIRDDGGNALFHWRKSRSQYNRRSRYENRRRSNRRNRPGHPPYRELPPPVLSRQPAPSFNFIDNCFHQVNEPEEFVRSPNTKTFVYNFTLAGHSRGKIYLHVFTGAEFFNIIEKEFVAKMAWNFLIVSSSSILIFIVIAFFVARSISSPLETIASGVKKVSDGDFQVDILPQGANEIQELAIGFNDMKEALLQKEKMRSQMTSDIAHELRTPLTILRGEVEGMLDRVIKIDDDALRLLLDETGRLEQIVNSLKSIWDMEKQKSSLNIEKIDIGSFVRDLVTGLSMVAKNENVNLKFSDLDEEIVVLADSYHLSMALRNVVINGIKYSGDAGVVLCSIKKAGDRVKLIVSDNGNGISEEDRTLIFERFYRADASRNRKTGGAGLGLAIACEAMKSMSGSISVENNKDGGAEFILELPLG